MMVLLVIGKNCCCIEFWGFILVKKFKKTIAFTESDIKKGALL